MGTCVTRANGFFILILSRTRKAYVNIIRRAHDHFCFFLLRLHCFFPFFVAKSVTQRRYNKKTSNESMVVENRNIQACDECRCDRSADIDQMIRLLHFKQSTHISSI